MKKIRIYVLFLVLLGIFMLAACDEEHTHNFVYETEDSGHIYICDCGEKMGEIMSHSFVWGDTSSFDTAFRVCNKCGYKEYQKDLNKSPVESVSSIDGDPGEICPIYFKAEVDSGIYGYGDEFEIRLAVTIPNSYFGGGSLFVKLEESPYFEVIGDGEYEVNNFFLSATGSQTHSFIFKLKATNPSAVPEAFDFKIKFKPTDECINSIQHYSKDGMWYYDPDSEYFFGFRQLMFMSDSVGIIVSDWSQKLFYDSINREFLSGIIDRDTYIDRLVEYNTEDRVYVNPTGQNLVQYMSKNIRAEVKLGEEYSHFFDLGTDFEGICRIVAETVLEILRENGLITSEQYEAEKSYISEKGYCYGLKYTYYELIPIEEYVKNNFYNIKYYFEEKEEN